MNIKRSIKRSAFITIAIVLAMGFLVGSIKLGAYLLGDSLGMPLGMVTFTFIFLTVVLSFD